MAKQKDDRATLELEGLAKPIGRPKGVKAPLTAAEKMRAYRERKAKKGINSFEFSFGEQNLIFMLVKNHDFMLVINHEKGFEEEKKMCREIMRKLNDKI